MNIFKIELKRAIQNKWMLFSFLIALIICLYRIPEKYEYMKTIYENGHNLGYDKILCTTTVVQQWLLYDRLDTLLYLFIFIMPILATLPYGASYYNDRKSGYTKQLLSRCSFKKYAIAKYSATFISGGIVITLPLIIQFVILSFIFPTLKPMRFGTPIIGEMSFGIELFYNHPIFHALMWCVIVFIVAGLLATISLSVSRFVYNYFAVILTPFTFSFILIFLTYVTGKRELSLINTVSSWSDYSLNYWILFAEIIIIFLTTFCSFIYQKKEVL